MSEMLLHYWGFRSFDNMVTAGSLSRGKNLRRHISEDKFSEFMAVPCPSPSRGGGGSELRQSEVKKEESGGDAFQGRYQPR